MMKKYTRYPLMGLLSCFLLSGLLMSSCRQGTTSKAHVAAPVGHAEIKYAKGFSIDYYKGYKLLRIFSGFGVKRDTIQYVLLGKGAQAPDGFSQSELIHIPLKSLVAMSSMHVALADFAGEANAIVGLGSLKYVSSPTVLANIKAGRVKEVGMDGTMNDELLIGMKPDLVMVMGNPDAKFSKYKTLTAAGVAVMLNSEWLETTPLGRAEWVKVMGALMDKEEVVNRKFNAIEKEYGRLAEIGRNAAIKPSVICGMPYKGTWYVPDGDSYMVTFLKDAGTSYKWADVHGTGSLALNFETVAPEALKADFWLNIGYVDTKKDIRAIDARYADFKPFKTGRLFNNNGKVNEQGSNDYWESGAVNPQLVLGDMIRILHPELLPDYQLVYYKQLKD